MLLWKEHSDKNNLPWRKINRTLAVNFLADILKKKQNDSKISKGLMILEAIGLLMKVESHYNFANEYLFPILTDDMKKDIIAKAECIRYNFNKPMNEVTRDKLKKLFSKKVDGNNYTK